MEQKLAEFRARRTVQKQATKPENNAESCFPETQTAPTDAIGSTESKTLLTEENRDWLLDSAVGRWLGVHCLAKVTVLKVLLWLVLMGLFFELDFGLPFFLLSLFYWLYEGLRSPAVKRPGELSAYSVFNPNCQPILGTLTAEQLEGEMGYRPLNNRVTT